MRYVLLLIISLFLTGCVDPTNRSVYKDDTIYQDHGCRVFEFEKDGKKYLISNYGFILEIKNDQ